MSNSINYYEKNVSNQSFGIRYESKNGIQYVYVTPVFDEPIFNHRSSQEGMMLDFQSKKGAPLTENEIDNKINQLIEDVFNNVQYKRLVNMKNDPNQKEWASKGIVYPTLREYEVMRSNSDNK